MPNGATEIKGLMCEDSGAHVSEATELRLQTMAAPSAARPQAKVVALRARLGEFKTDANMHCAYQVNKKKNNTITAAASAREIGSNKLVPLSGSGGFCKDL